MYLCSMRTFKDQERDADIVARNKQYYKELSLDPIICLERRVTELERQFRLLKGKNVYDLNSVTREVRRFK